MQWWADHLPYDGPVMIEATVENKDIGFVHAGQDVEALDVLLKGRMAAVRWSWSATSGRPDL